jgi:hypothetical protein
MMVKLVDLPNMPERGLPPSQVPLQRVPSADSPNILSVLGG